MAVCYNNLWKILIDRNMNRTDLKDAAGVSFNVMARLGKNEAVSFESIEKICLALNCNIGDIVEITTEPIVPKTFTSIELFAGAGGLALGIEKAGFDTLGLIEFDKDAADTLKCNRPNWRVIHDDIANISCLDLTMNRMKEITSPPMRQTVFSLFPERMKIRFMQSGSRWSI